MFANLKNDDELFQEPRINKSSLEGLSDFQKILLITDGTVTELLECHTGDSILIEKLYEGLEIDVNQLSEEHRTLVKEKDLPVLRRKVLLQGKSTANNWLYAESCILIKHLDADFRKELLSSKKPIGKLWAKHRVETFKTVPIVQQEQAGDELSSFFKIPENSTILSRTYSVFSQKKQTMIITEKFPVSLYGN